MVRSFLTDYSSIIQAVEEIDPLAYGETRNFIDGAVTYLSPYISRGVISTRFVFSQVMNKGYRLKEIESFVKELCWRDYFQRVQQNRDINEDLKHTQTPVRHIEIPKNVVQGNTNIQGIDNAIHSMYNSGYMHNHGRMYTAFLTCNVAQIHWLKPARWMYYHLLDGDWASNACSWQWVAGSNSSKKYVANQENINRFTRTNQKNTYLDVTYEELLQEPIPEVLQETQNLGLQTLLPASNPITLVEQEPVFVYNYYNLDPNWHRDEHGNRILLLEPDFFEKYPVSEKCIHFALELAKNIPNIQILVGSFESLQERCTSSTIYFKEHPFNSHYRGVEEPRDWIVPEIQGYFPSFFNYWKKIERHIREEFESSLES